jgi:hypothetical protein
MNSYEQLLLEVKQLQRSNDSLQERLRQCRKELAKIDFEFDQLLPKYHALLLARGKPNETLDIHEPR